MRFERVGGLAQKFEAFLHCGVVDDADVAEIAEVGREFHLQLEREAVVGVLHIQHMSHKDARGEHRGIAACDDGVALLAHSVSGDVIDVGDVGGGALPVQIAEIAFALDGATDVRLTVEHGDDHGVVPRHHIDHAHNAVAASHAHVGMDTVVAPLVERDEVLGLVDGVADYLGVYF